MKKITFLLVCLVSMFSMSAFSQIKEGFKQDKSGLWYKAEKMNPSGRLTKEGDIVIGNYSMAYGDSVVFSSFGKPTQPCFGAMEQNRAFKGDLIDGLFLMREGEIYEFAFTYDSLSKVQSVPDFFKQGDYAYFKVYIDKLMSTEEFNAEQQRLMEEQKKIADSLQAIEMQVLVDYVRQNGFSDIPTNGVYYKQTKEGNGTKVENGNKVKVHYVGRFLDGKVFDTSVESVAKESGVYNPQRNYEPLPFTIGKRQMIVGFEEAVKMMTIGEKGIVVILSNLAYGARQRGEIPPFSTLVFELELVEIEK